MQPTLRMETTILPGHRLEISAPELPEGAKVEVIVVLPEPSKPHRMSMLELLETLPPGPRAFPTWDEYERHLREEGTGLGADRVVGTDSVDEPVELLARGGPLLALAGGTRAHELVLVDLSGDRRVHGRVRARLHAPRQDRRSERARREPRPNGRSCRRACRSPPRSGRWCERCPRSPPPPWCRARQ